MVVCACCDGLLSLYKLHQIMLVAVTFLGEGVKLMRAVCNRVVTELLDNCGNYLLAVAGSGR